MDPSQLAVQKFIELEKKKAEVKRYFDELNQALEEVVTQIGIGGHFQDLEGTVYQIVIPEGRFVHYEKYGYVRTRREGEKRGDLSLIKAKELGYIVD